MFCELAVSHPEPVALGILEFFPTGRQEAVQSSQVRASRTHASDDEVAIGNNGLDLEGQVRKLGDQPLHSSSHRGRSFHATRCTHCLLYTSDAADEADS